MNNCGKIVIGPPKMIDSLYRMIELQSTVELAAFLNSLLVTDFIFFYILEISLSFVTVYIILWVTLPAYFLFFFLLSSILFHIASLCR